MKLQLNVVTCRSGLPYMGYDYMLSATILLLCVYVWTIMIILARLQHVQG